MPPRKRPSSPEASGSGESSGPTQKRPRSSRTTNGVSGPVGVLEEDAEDSQEEEEGDLDLSQQRDFNPNFSDKVEAEVGIIEQVCLKNFMCHTRLEFKFCPQVNFIIGQNGSGKSAVLTSIVIGLGGKANVTNRGTSVKGFIKTGKQAAEVLVKLRNQGQDAYKPDLYGRSIIVERRLSREGSTSYKLKSHDGRLVSTKREELNHILDSFNIQVDNPVAVLNQDCSRNFLHSKNAGDKYKFFLKATQLEQLKHDYVLATDAKEGALEVLRQKKSTMPALEQEVTEVEEKYKASKAVSGLNDRVKQLKDEQAWAIIVKAERDFEKTTRELGVEESRRPKYLAAVEKHEKELTDLKNKRKELHAKIQEICTEASDMETKHKDAKREQNEAKLAFRNAQLEAKKVTSEWKTTADDHRAIIDKIEELKNSAQQDYESERQARNKKIAELEESIASLNATHQTTEHELNQFRSTITRLKEDQYKLRSDDNELARKKEGLHHQLRDLKAARQNRMKRFGHWMPQLLARIDEQFKRGAFHKKPRGPLGNYLELADPNWAVAVESCIKSLIHAFTVNDHHDERVLEAIFAQTCPEGKKPATITAKFQEERYDVSAYRPQTNAYLTVLDMLQIKDPVVANCLIDQRSIENILLIKNNEEARRVMMHSPPRNVREAFTAVGDQVYSVPIFRYYSNSQTKANILTSSVEENVRFLEGEVQQVDAERQRINAQQRELTAQINQNQKNANACDTRLMKLRSQISKVNLELTDLREREDPAPVDITTLEEEAAQLNQHIKVLEDKKAQVESKVTEKREELLAKEEAFKALDEHLMQLADSTEPFKENRAQLDNKIETAEGHKAHYVQKKKEHDRKLDEIHSKHNKQKEKLEEDTEKAKRLSDRIETRRTPENIESEIKQISKQIAKQEKNRGNHEEITRKYHELKESYRSIMKEVNQLNNFLKALDNVMEDRQKHFYEFRKMIAIRVKYFFIVMLSNRNYTGKLTFNHEKELLTMSVTPNSANTGEGSKDMKSLSGGERSFATVCFILSLWDAMESPFRCLDEFDVFMDLVNRRIATEMMLNVASQQKGRQFIFLTPLELSQMRIDNNIRVYRMPDPDRGQGIINVRAINGAAANEEEEQEEEG